MWPYRKAETSISDVPPQDASFSQQTQSSARPAVAFETRPIDHPTAENLTPETIQWRGLPGERLGIPAIARIPLLMGASAFSGFALGAAKGGPIAADRYRAENAHRFPTTRSGWYLYHKTKNYHMFLGSIKEGLKFGTVLMGWATMFAITEEMIDKSRARMFTSRDEDEEEIRTAGQRDVASTVMAAMTVAGAYSLSSGLDKHAAARMSKMAFKYSLVFGFAQDALASLRSDRPSYVNWILQKLNIGITKTDPV